MKAAKILADTDFAVGDFVRVRRWSLDENPKPIIEKRIRRIVEIRESADRTIFVCGGNAQFESFEIIPA